MSHYNDAVLDLTRTETPDPYVTYSDATRKFYLMFTAGDRLEIWRANSLPAFHDDPDKHIIWRPPPRTEHSNDLWAPELHCLRGRWYVYYAACHPKHGNKSHRMFVLAGPPADHDPATGSWEFVGPIRGMNQNQWAIDGTVIELAGQLYFVYSGWPFHNPHQSDLLQHLFILRLSDPITAASDPVEICRPDKPFECVGDHGINEGPQYLASQDGAWVGIVYSCSGSWTNEYKMNCLRYTGGDPLSQSSWQKSTKPLIKSGSHGNGPWGPGHGSFMHIGDDVFGIYHATDRPDDGWGNRRARMQRVIFTPRGPWMGETVGKRISSMNAFVGNSHQQNHQQPAGSADQKHGIKGFLQRIKDEL